jgi:uncharacterized CHY-type Zn-finger protein
LVFEVLASESDNDHLFQQMDATLHQDTNLLLRKYVNTREPQIDYRKFKWVHSNTSPTTNSSPVHRLPTEVLSQIFLLCFPQDQPGLDPVLLTAVCRRWREVAVGFPKLWCNLQFQADPNAYDSAWDWQQRALFYDSLLKRSRGRPLSLKIRCQKYCAPFVCHDELNELLRDVLEPYIKQISSLTLDFLDVGKPFTVADFHALKELTIIKRGFDLEHCIDLSLKALPDNLRKLDLTHCSLKLNEEIIRSCTVYTLTWTGWTLLTHVKIRVHCLVEILHLLPQCPNLSSLSMIDVMNPIKYAFPERTTHPKLQHLHIRASLFGDDDVGVGLFNALTLPNFGHLDFRHNGPWPHGEFKAFVTRSKCPLESLIFGMSMTLTDQEQKECTSLIPSLKRIVGKGYSRDIDPIEN